MKPLNCDFERLELFQVTFRRRRLHFMSCCCASCRSVGTCRTNRFGDQTGLSFRLSSPPFKRHSCVVRTMALRPRSRLSLPSSIFMLTIKLRRHHLGLGGTNRVTIAFDRILAPIVARTDSLTVHFSFHLLSQDALLDIYTKSWTLCGWAKNNGHVSTWCFEA